MEKKIPFRLTAALGAYLVIEVLAFAAFWMATGGPFSFARVGARRVAARTGANQELSALRPNDSGGWTFEDSILHPYLGYARQPGDDTHFFGFRTVAARPGVADGPTIVVGITGGSVGQLFFDWATSHPRWEEDLRSVSGLEGASFEYVHLGLRGYKQPQQLLATAYYLSLGGRLDLLLNIDGFNEIGLGAELLDNGVSPLYPYHWLALTGAQLEPQVLRRLGKLASLRAKRGTYEAISRPLFWSPAVGLIWWQSDRRLEAKIANVERSFSVSEGAGALPYFRGGPPLPPDADFDRFIAQIWSRSSKQMQALAEGHEFSYFHFLQPNQYVPDSKPLSRAEEQILLPDLPSSRHVRSGYPLLIEEGERLREAGVSFHDITNVFRSEPATLYIDPCCHFNERGNELLAQEMVRRIRDELGSAEPAAAPIPREPAE